MCWRSRARPGLSSQGRIIIIIIIIIIDCRR
jgi:hypothetical protein